MSTTSAKVLFKKPNNFNFKILLKTMLTII